MAHEMTKRETWEKRGVKKNKRLVQGKKENETPWEDITLAERPGVLYYH